MSDSHEREYSRATFGDLVLRKVIASRFHFTPFEEHGVKGYRINELRRAGRAPKVRQATAKRDDRGDVVERSEQREREGIRRKPLKGGRA